MANYSLISNAVFQPFTYQELTAPLDRSELVHDQLDEQYDLLAEKADLLSRLEGSLIDKDSPITQQYRNYRNNISDEVNALNKYGLNPASKSRWHDLRRRYGQEIAPIQQMWNKREEEVKLQDAAVNADPSLVFTRDARQSPLEFYRDNPLGGYKAYSGKMFADVVSRVAKNLKEVARQGANGKYIQMSHISPEMYELVVKNGYTPEQIDNWRNDPILTNIMATALNSMGITPDNLGTEYERIKDKMVSWGEMALTDAIGKPTISNAEDKPYMKGLEHRYHEAEADSNYRRTAALEGLKHRYNMAEKAADNQYQKERLYLQAALSGSKGSGSGSNDEPKVPPFPVEPEYLTLVKDNPGERSNLEKHSKTLKIDGAKPGKQKITITPDKTGHPYVPGVTGGPLPTSPSQSRIDLKSTATKAKSIAGNADFERGAAIALKNSPAYSLLSPKDKKLVDDVASGKKKLKPTVSTRSSFDADIWNPKTNKLYSKAEFQRQGTTIKEINALGKYYDQQIKPSMDAMDIKPGDSYAKAQRKYNQAYKDTYSMNVPAIDLGVPDPDVFQSHAHMNAYTVNGYNKKTHSVELGESTAFADYFDDKKFSLSNAGIVKHGKKYGFMMRVSAINNSTYKPREIFVPLNTDLQGNRNATAYLSRAEFYQKALDAYKKGGKEAYDRVFTEAYAELSKGNRGMEGYLSEYLPKVSPEQLESIVYEQQRLAVAQILQSSGKKYKVNAWEANHQK